MHQAESPSPRHDRAALVITALVTAVVVGTAAYGLGRLSDPERATPGNTSAEAGFARDMQVHHIQGVEMAMIIRERTSDSDVRLLAYDIATTQSHQAGQLYGWLAEWDLNQLGSQPPMAWMMDVGAADGGGEGATRVMAMNARMPGMATSAQMAELSEVSGAEAERLFLTLMILHHQGALDMADAVLARSNDAGVRTFAYAVLTSQQAEIDLMNQMLAEREEPTERVLAGSS